LQIEMRSRPQKNNWQAMVTQWLVNAVGLVLASRIIRGIEIDASGMEGLVTVLGASAVLGLLNLLLKPFLILITLPINILTLGLFTLVINGLVLNLASYFVKGFVVQGFWAAVFGALFLSFMNLVLNGFLFTFKVIRK
jgi:putative membrane protein